MIWINLIPSLSLPAIWLLAHLLAGWQRSKYIISQVYLFLSWMMITAAFTTNWPGTSRGYVCSVGRLRTLAAGSLAGEANSRLDGSPMVFGRL